MPNELREASYALGVPKWKTIVKVVLPTAIAGILTGITLAIARVIGETAPLLVTAGIAAGTNLNPFSGRMTTLPVYAYYQYAQPGVPRENGIDRAWAAALTLIIIVAILFTVARVLARLLQAERTCDEHHQRRRVGPAGARRAAYADRRGPARPGDRRRTTTRRRSIAASRPCRCRTTSTPPTASWPST